MQYDDPVASWVFYETVEDDEQDLQRYRFIDGSRLNHIFEHHGPDKWFMSNFVKKQLPTILERTKQDANIASFEAFTPAQAFSLFVTDSFLGMLTSRVNSYLHKRREKKLTSAIVKNCLLAWLLSTLYGKAVGKLFDSSTSCLYATPANVSERDMRAVLRGLEGDSGAFSHISEETGTWVHDGQYDRELLELENIMACICSRRIFVDGSCVLSIDDDQLAMRSKKMVDSLGLSYHVNPRTREGPIQVALCDLAWFLFIFALSFQRREL